MLEIVGVVRTIEVSDPRDPRLWPYFDVREKQLKDATAAHPDASGLFLAEGERVVELLLASRFRTHSVLLTPARLATLAPAIARLAPDVPVYVLPQAMMNQAVGFNIHRGVLAAGHRAANPTIDDLLAGGLLDRACVVAEGLTNHDNVGAIFRNIACLGGTDVPLLFSPDCCDPLYRKSIRVSMGHALRVPFATVPAWPEGLARLRAAGMTILALTPDPQAVDLATLDANSIPRPALLLGAEGPGLTPEAFATADVRVRIGQSASADSLNVGVAAAIALHRLVTPGSSEPKAARSV